MDGRSILLAMLPVALTLINYAIIRDLIWGIFLGSKSKKSALKIKAEQKGMAAFRQSYIGAHLKKYEKDYTKWMTIKLCTFIFAIVQLAAFIVLIAVLKLAFWIIAIICAVIIVLNIVLFILMMKETATSTNKKSTKGSPWRFEQ
ncbi:MAG: hypothetical protein IK130_11225 [Oscillospiraceae bacterium]|nr:hypothetical protein [Oscillospiraceae bacterium]